MLCVSVAGWSGVRVVVTARVALSEKQRLVASCAVGEDRIERALAHQFVLSNLFVRRSS